MLASLSNVCEDRVIPHIFAEFLIFIALSSKASVMIQISLLVSVIVFSIIFCLLGVGRGVCPVGALPPYLPTLLLTHFIHPKSPFMIQSIMFCLPPFIELSDNLWLFLGF